jgi:hypothetical protein
MSHRNHRKEIIVMNELALPFFKEQIRNLHVEANKDLKNLYSITRSVFKNLNPQRRVIGMITRPYVRCHNILDLTMNIS